jgi:hypothetical protein
MAKQQLKQSFHDAVLAYLFVTPQFSSRRFKGLLTQHAPHGGLATVKQLLNSTNNGRKPHTWGVEFLVYDPRFISQFEPHEIDEAKLRMKKVA